MNGKLLWQILKESGIAWFEDKAPRLGAALAYYSLFSLAPLLLIAIAVAGLIFGEQAARGEVFHQVQSAVGPTAAAALEGLLKSAARGTTLATVVGGVLALFGASGVFVELQDALNTIWRVPPPKRSGLWDAIRSRLLSFAVVLGTGLLLLASLVATAALAAPSGTLDSITSLPGGAWLWQGVNFLLSFVLMALLFALIFKVLPDAAIAWRDVWLGAAVTALLFSLGKYAIGLYLGRTGVTSVFGAAGSLIALLVWIYYSAQILLFGAEFTWVWSHKRGSRAGQAPPPPLPARAGREARVTV
jgi:membrane protein